jgi:ornithine cyclodeaminase
MARFEKIPADEAAADGLTCSFCGREPPDGSDLIAGDQASICDECVAACVDVLARDERTPQPDADAEDAEPDPDAEEQHARRITFRLLDEADVARLISIDDLMDPMEGALRGFSSGQVVQPQRTVLPIDPGDAVMAVMPVYGREPAVLGAKVVSVFNTNTAIDLPTHLATVFLLNPATGALLAILAGTYITEIRTAAVSAISVNLLARDDAASLAIIGSGVQARSHLRAIDLVWELSDVRVWSPTPEHQEAFVDEMQSSTTARLVSAESAEDAVRGADLVVLATSSAEPVVESAWVRDGAHIISVGACRPEQREMDPALVRRGRLFVDSRAAALVESGDVVQGIRERLFTPSHIIGELGELLDKRVEGRRSSRDVTIFKSLGLAVEDIVAAELVYRRALAQGMGRDLDL